MKIHQTTASILFRQVINLSIVLGVSNLSFIAILFLLQETVG